MVNNSAMTAGGSPFQPSVLALQAATNAVGVTVKVVAAAAPTTQAAKLNMYVCTSPENLSAAAAPFALGRSASLYVCDLPFCKSGAIIIMQSNPMVVNGGFVYCWFDCPSYLGNLTATAVETTV
jgi:hypothetical protein